MKTNIKATGMELTPALRGYVEDKLEYVERFLDPSDQSVMANVEIGKTTQHHQHGEFFRAEINLHTGAGHFRAEAVAGDLYAAIDQLKDEIGAEIKNAKTKRHTLLRRGSRRLKSMLRGLNPWRKS